MIRFKELLDSYLAIQWHDLSIWYYLVRVYSDTAQILSKYDNIISYFGKWLDKSYHITLKSIDFHSLKNTYYFILVTTDVIEKADLVWTFWWQQWNKTSQLFKYFIARHKSIPIFEYTELEFLLLGYKYHKNIKQRYFVILCQKTKLKKC